MTEDKKVRILTLGCGPKATQGSFPGDAKGGN